MNKLDKQIDLIIWKLILNDADKEDVFVGRNKIKQSILKAIMENKPQVWVYDGNAKHRSPVVTSRNKALQEFESVIKEILK